ncbi:hypothetical protein AK88_04180 [Plasmodium fragile]|uniref:Uncharacterized protein n=1 Tax=Plasmodium fragile TaxID=5857 RepID=A0A0D9QGS9_PLAFR|nr:uncharacterized protein AK88_04180 [Plasmodium fragile]KJP86209.1 hypothetical protein AK88_04180 [Plasmodium fragile]
MKRICTECGYDIEKPVVRVINGEMAEWLVREGRLMDKIGHMEGSMPCEQDWKEYIASKGVTEKVKDISKKLPEGALHCNEHNHGVHTQQLSLRAGRMLFEHASLQKNIDVSTTSLGSLDSIFNSNNPGNTDRIYNSATGAFGNDFESSIGTISTNDPKSVASSISTFHVDTSSKGSHEDVASNNQSTIGDSILFDIPDNNSVSSHNSGSTAWSTATGSSTASGSTTSHSFHKRKRPKYYDGSYEDLQTVEEREQMQRAKEMAQRKKILDESNYDLENVGNNFKGHLNKYDIQNKDKNNYEFNSEKSLDSRLKEKNDAEHKSRKDRKKRSRKSRKSKRTAESEAESESDSSSYLSNDTIDQSDESIFGVNQRDTLLKKIRECSPEDREKMRKILKKLKKHRKNTKLEDLEHALSYELEGFTTHSNTDDDASSTITSSTSGTIPDSVSDSSPFVGRRQSAKKRSKENPGNDIKELRSYIDQTMDGNNAEVAHLLVNKIEKYKEKVTKLKEKNMQDVNYMNMKHKHKLKKFLYFVPLITLATIVVVGLLVASIWNAPGLIGYIIAALAFVFGSLICYGIMGKVMFNSALGMIDGLWGAHPYMAVDYIII